MRRHTDTTVDQEQPATGLAQTLRPRHVTMIALGGIVGAGLFVGSSSAIAFGGPAVILTYAAVGVLVFLIMRMLAEMAVADPGRGSFAEYSAVALGDWAGFVIRWLYFYFNMLASGAEAVAAAKLVHAAGLPGPVWAIGIGLVTLMTGFNLASVNVYGELEFWFAMLKVSAIVSFIAVGLLFIIGTAHGPMHALQNIIGHGGFMPLGVSGVLSAVPIAMFAMVGSEIATIAAVESKDPVANAVRAARSVAVRVLAFYVLSLAVIVAIVPWRSVVPGLSPFKTVLDVIGIPGSGLVMLIIIITAVLSVLNSQLYLTSRMLYELARSGGAPKALSKTGKNRVPRLGILIGCSAAYAGVIAQFFMRQDVFTLLVTASGYLMLVIYIIVAAAQIGFRRKLEAAGVVLKLKMWLFPWLSYAVIAALIGITVSLTILSQNRMTVLLLGVVPVAFAGTAAWAFRDRLARSGHRMQLENGSAGCTSGVEKSEEACATGP